MQHHSEAGSRATIYPARITRAFKRTSQDMVDNKKFDLAIETASKNVTSTTRARVAQQRHTAVENLVAVIDRIAEQGGLHNRVTAQNALGALVTAATGISPKTEMAKMLKDAWDRHSLEAARNFGNEFVAHSIGVKIFTDFASEPNVIRDTLPGPTKRRCLAEHGLE